jgi:hypothetical protein
MYDPELSGQIPMVKGTTFDDKRGDLSDGNLFSGSKVHVLRSLFQPLEALLRDAPHSIKSPPFFNSRYP